MRPYLSALARESGEQVERRRLAHVVGVGLEGKAEHCDPLAGEVAAAGPPHAVNQVALAPGIGLDDRRDDALRRAEGLAHAHEGFGILREAGATVARARLQELRPEPRVPDRKSVVSGKSVSGRVEHGW